MKIYHKKCLFDKSSYRQLHPTLNIRELPTLMEGRPLPTIRENLHLKSKTSSFKEFSILFLSCKNFEKK